MKCNFSGVKYHQSDPIAPPAVSYRESEVVWLTCALWL